MAITRSSRAITSTDPSPASALGWRIALIVGLTIGTAGLSKSFNPGAQPLVPQPGPASPSFFDPFDRLDTSRWYISDGWVDGDQQGCTWSRDNLSVSSGMLQLRLGKASNPLRQYRCGQLQSTAVLGYGVYEARMRTAAGSGLNTAMFTYDKATRDEVDFEFLGRSTEQVQLNYYTAGKGGHETAPHLGFDAAGAFHNYAFVWAPGSVEWYIDGKLVRKESGATLPTNPGHMIFSLWNGSSSMTGWLGAFDTARTPVLAEVDWAAYTRPGEHCRFSASITCAKH